MAVQPPAAPSPLPAPVGQPAAAVAPPAKSRGCLGCGMGCGGCLLVIVIVAALLLGSGYFFLVAQAQAGVASPAALLVYSTPVEVGKNDSGYMPAASGQSLDAGSSVRTGDTGHASIQFPDGTLTRLAPNTTVTVQAAQLTNGGQLKSATVLQKIGRTLSTVQHLTGGASFNVGGHSVSAEVRGTQFEVLVRGDGSNLIKVFDGTVKVSGKTTISLTRGQEVDADKNGTLSAPRPIRPDRLDPYQLVAQCENAASSSATPSTSQVSTGDNLATGQTAESDYYYFGGGVLAVFLCYPGSSMTLDFIDPSGTHEGPAAGTSPVRISVSAFVPGLYRAIVRAVNVPGGEPWAVVWATNAVCGGDKVDTGNVVREVLTNAQLSSGLADSGATGITIQVQGVSSNSATIYYYSNIGGVELSWTIDFYAATPNLGAVLTQVTVKGINLTTQVVSRLTSYGASISSIPTDYIVDRVYSCVGPGGNTMVIEGHR